jgi:DNA invertase Pin-like site-specific DNA recombinase
VALVGYARVSTAEQNLDLQRSALAAAGCEEVHEDHASGAKAERPGLAEALGHVRRGDTLVVWKLDRLGRSLAHLIDTVRTLEAEGVGFRSLTEGVDTTTPGGMLVFHIFGALAQFERDLIRERTSAGLKAAEARGRKGGRRPGRDARQAGSRQGPPRRRADGARGRRAAEGGQDRALQGAERLSQRGQRLSSPPVHVWRTQRSLSCSDPWSWTRPAS